MGVSVVLKDVVYGLHRINPDTGEKTEVGLIKIKSIDNEVVVKSVCKGDFMEMKEFIACYYA